MEAYVTKQQRIHHRTVWFRLCYILMLAAFGVGLYFGLGRLEDWLERFEAAQPKTACENTFRELFTDPDWLALYTLAELEDTPFEGKEAFGTYMEEKTSGKVLSYYETSAGLSGNHKYVVTADGDRIAVFTLTPEKSSGTGIPGWKLGEVEFFFQRSQSVTVCTDMGCTVYINGVPLSEEYTVQTLTTEAENYLPDGIHGKRLRWQYVPGLLIAPTVTAVDENGQEVALVYEEATTTYTQQLSEMTISQEQIDTVVAAARVYCRYMIGDTGKTTLKKHFNSSSTIYKTITKSDTWMQGYSGFAFSDYALDGFYRYSDTLWSVHLTMTLNVKRANGSIKEYPLDATFFLEKTDGEWLVCQMTNVDAQQETCLVRLTYVMPDGTQQAQMTDAAATQLIPPEIAAPEGQVFIGWYLLQTDAAGNSSYQLAFLPDESGTVYLSQDTELTHMTLYPLFEDIKEEA